MNSRVSLHSGIDLLLPPQIKTIVGKARSLDGTPHVSKLVKTPSSTQRQPPPQLETDAFDDVCACEHMSQKMSAGMPIVIQENESAPLVPLLNELSQRVDEARL